LERAFAIAGAQQARFRELRAAMRMARHDHGKRLQAHHGRTPVYRQYTGGFGTPDLKDAKALLDERAS